MIATVRRVGVTLYGPDTKRLAGWCYPTRRGTVFYRGLLAEAFLQLPAVAVDRVVIDLFVELGARDRVVTWDHKMESGRDRGTWPALLDDAMLGLQMEIEQLGGNERPRGDA